MLDIGVWQTLHDGQVNKTSGTDLFAVAVPFPVDKAIVKVSANILAQRNYYEIGYLQQRWAGEYDVAVTNQPLIVNDYQLIQLQVCNEGALIVDVKGWLLQYGLFIRVRKV